jgi:NADPH2:quinone reductase
MRAIRFDRFGDPDRVLELATIPAPQPGPNEIRVRLTHRPINPSDLLCIQGKYRISAAPPMSPGLEGVGVIDAIGDGVTGMVMGQRVITLAGVPGTWAEYIVIRAEHALPIPDAIDDVAAAQLLVNPITAWALVCDELPLREGDWLLQTAASSALGAIIIQLARRRGVKTLNVVRRRDHVERIIDAGGDAVVCTADEFWAEQVRERATEGVAVVVDPVGGELAPRLIPLLRSGGTLCVLGLLAGNTLGPLDAGTLIFNALSIRGFWLSEWATRRPLDVLSRAFAEVMTLLVTGELRLSAAAEYDLSNFQSALQHASRPGRDGKILLVG